MPNTFFYRLLVVFLGTHLENRDRCIIGLQMNVSISLHMKGFASALFIGLMIVIVVAYATTSFFFAPNFGAKAYAQVDNNSNSSDREAAQLEVLEDINITSTKLASQGAYTALSVFFLGISLVVFGLRLTTRVAPRIGRSLTIMVWGLTVPVIILIGLFQYGEITGTPLITVTEEPYFLLSFLLYIPIAIVIFLLLEQKGIVEDQAAHISKPVLEMEKLVQLKERGAITEEEFQKLKADLLAKL